MTAPAFVVAGEDAPLGLVLTLGAVGLACAAATLATLAGAGASASSSPPPSRPAMAAPPVSASAAVAPAAVAPAAVAPAAVAPAAVTAVSPAPAASAPCPDLVLHFAAGRAELGAAEARTARVVAAYLHAHPQARVELDGHASASGGELANLRLSRRRADAVVAVLTQAGVDAARAVVRGFGAYVPADASAPEASSHRRVVVRLRGAVAPGAGCPAVPDFPQVPASEEPVAP